MLIFGTFIVFNEVTALSKEVNMKRLLKKFEDTMVAITFAEAGEFDEANRALNAIQEKDQEGVAQSLQNIQDKVAVKRA